MNAVLTKVDLGVCRPVLSRLAVAGKSQILELTPRTSQESGTVAIAVSSRMGGGERAIYDTYENPSTPSSLWRHVFKSMLGMLKLAPTEHIMVKELPSSAGPTQRSLSCKATSPVWRRDWELEVPDASSEIEPRRTREYDKLSTLR